MLLRLLPLRDEFGESGTKLKMLAEGVENDVVEEGRREGGRSDRRRLDEERRRCEPLRRDPALKEGESKRKVTVSLP